MVSTDSARTEQMALLEALARYELVVSELYTFYAEKFPASRELWSTLASEEIGHANLATRLRDLVAEGEIDLPMDRLAEDELGRALSYLRHRVFSAQTHDISEIQALMVAIDIENGIIEKQIFESLEDDPAVLAKAFQSLKCDCQDHYNRLHRHRARLIGAAGGN